MPTAAPKVFTYSALTVTPVLDANGNTTGETGTFNLVGIPPDTYNIVVSSPGYAPYTIPNVAFSTTDNTITPPVTTSQNVYDLSATLAQPTTVTGTIGLEGVPNFSAVSPNAPIGPITVSFYTPGTVAFGNGAVPLYTQTVTTLTPTSDPTVDSYTVSNIPFGTYDVVVKTPKNLAVKASSVVLANQTGDTIPLVILPAGDSDNNDTVDSSDFGNLIGVFGADSTIPGSGYTAADDFNYDGIIDSSDFGLLIGEFNNFGAI